MHIEFLVEEVSTEAALMNLVPRIVGSEVTFRIHAHEGKLDLLRKLPGRLKGYRHWIAGDVRIVVLHDEDRQDCAELKGNLERAARAAGLATQSKRRKDGSFVVLNRIAVEELEAWFFGDVPALAAAYPGVPPTLGARAPYRNPDVIAGGTWEALELVLQRAGYYPSGLPKIETARNISAHMDPERNSSRSFRLLRDSLRALAPGSRRP